MARSSRRRSSGSKQKYFWGGIQLPATNVGTGGVTAIILGTSDSFLNPGVIRSIRGTLEVTNGGSDKASGAVQWGAKIMVVELNDSFTMSGDNAGIDTDVEDIARRQLWTGHGVIPAVAAATPERPTRFDLNVKVAAKWEGSGKVGLLLIIDASVVNRIQFNCYIRALIAMS